MSGFLGLPNTPDTAACRPLLNALDAAMAVLVEIRPTGRRMENALSGAVVDRIGDAMGAIVNALHDDADDDTTPRLDAIRQRQDNARKEVVS